MSNLHTPKAVGDLIYFRRMQDYFEAVDPTEELKPAIVCTVGDGGDEYFLRSPGILGLKQPYWWAKWIDCFSGRDITVRADRYCDSMRLQNAVPGQRPLYDWYSRGGFEFFDILVNRKDIWGELTVSPNVYGAS